MQTEKLIRNVFRPVTIICALLLVLAWIASGFYIKKDLEPKLKYRSNFECDAKILVEGAIEWHMLDESHPRPVAGDRVKIISIYQDINERHTDIYRCMIIYFENNVPVGYSGMVDSRNLTTSFNNFKEESTKSHDTLVSFHRGMSEISFLIIVLMVIATAVFGIFNIPLMIYLAHESTYGQGRIRTAIIVDSVLIAFAVILILSVAF